MRVFWDVDTEKDFMLKNGKKYVPNAEEIIPNLSRLTKMVYDGKVLGLGSVDDHWENDPELTIHGEHCMHGTEGQKKIPETLLPKHLVTYIHSKVGLFGRYEDYSTDEVQIEIRNHRQIIFEKQSTDVFTNRNVMKFLDKLRVSEAVVYGVATEFCVKDAVFGLMNLGIKVYLVCDAIKGIDDKAIKSALWDMYHTGAKAVTTKQVIDGVFW